MELVFSSAAQAAINELATVRCTTDDACANVLAMRAGSTIDRELATTERIHSATPGRLVAYRNKTQIERSFIVRLISMMRRCYPNPDEYKNAVLKRFQSIQDGSVLSDIGFLSIAIAHGVVSLTDAELMMLIQGNFPDQSVGASAVIIPRNGGKLLRKE